MRMARHASMLTSVGVVTLSIKLCIVHVVVYAYLPVVEYSYMYMVNKKVLMIN